MEKAKKVFENTLKKQNEIEKIDFNLLKKSDYAKENIVNLQEEKEELRKNRPSMLANGEDVSKINKRLKEIDDEIELNQDLITGITEKRKNMECEIYSTRCDTNNAFKNLINWILSELDEKYMDVGSKFAEIVQDYITLEMIRDGNGTHYSNIDWNFTNIPNVKDNNIPLLKGNHYEIYSNNNEKVREKYSIPDFQVCQSRYKY